MKVNSFYEIKEYLKNSGFGLVNFLNNKCLYSSFLNFSFYPKRVKFSEFEKELSIINTQNSFRNNIKQIKIINNYKG